MGLLKLLWQQNLQMFCYVYPYLGLKRGEVKTNRNNNLRAEAPLREGSSTRCVTLLHHR